MTKAVDPKIRISGLSLLAIQQKIFDIQMNNPLVGHIKIIHTDHKLRKIILDLE